MRLISWNVNGIRAAVKKNFVPAALAMEADLICLQETKAQEDQVQQALQELGHFQVHANSAVKKGYAGTAVLTRVEPVDISMDLGIPEHDQEGRVITVEFADFFLVTVYTPNSGNELARLPYRQQWDQAFRSHLENLERRKPAIICGDLNVAHRPIDLARPAANYNRTAGYTQQEIDGLDKLLGAGFVDTFRHFHPDAVKYSWWSYRADSRAKNIGWRIDYFLASASLISRCERADILDQVTGSDHCPVLLELAS